MGADEAIPQSITTSELVVMGVKLVVHVLDNGKRIIESDGMHALFDAMASGASMTKDEALSLAKAVRP